MDNQRNNFSVWKYAGLATQFLAGIGILVWLGMKIDAWQQFRTPIAVWVLPLLFIVSVILRIIRETSRKK